MSKIQEAAGDYDKKVKAMTFEIAWNELLGLKGLLSYADKAASEGLQYLGVNRDKLAGVINRVIYESRQNAATLGAINIDTLQAVHASFREAISLKEALADIEHHIKALEEQIALVGQARGGAP